MRKTLLCLAGAALLALPLQAMAETTKHAASKPHPHHATQASARGGEATASRREIDKGPNTPDANRAYMGGGEVLEGAPGQPAPAPQAMPPAHGGAIR